MGILFNIYQAYYILAGIAGLALYPWVVILCRERLVQYTINPDKGEGMRGLLVGALVILACSAEVQFCFSRAATLIRMGA